MLRRAGIDSEDSSSRSRKEARSRIQVVPRGGFVRSRLNFVACGGLTWKQGTDNTVTFGSLVPHTSRVAHSPSIPTEFSHAPHFDVHPPSTIRQAWNFPPRPLPLWSHHARLRIRSTRTPRARRHLRRQAPNRRGRTCGRRGGKVVGKGVRTGVDSGQVDGGGRVEG